MMIDDLDEKANWLLHRFCGEEVNPAYGLSNEQCCTPERQPGQRGSRQGYAA